MRIWEPLILKEGASLSSSTVKGASMAALLGATGGGAELGIEYRRHCGLAYRRLVRGTACLSLVAHLGTLLASMTITDSNRTSRNGEGKVECTGQRAKSRKHDGATNSRPTLFGT